MTGVWHWLWPADPVQKAALPLLGLVVGHVWWVASGRGARRHRRRIEQAEHHQRAALVALEAAHRRAQAPRRQARRRPPRGPELWVRPPAQEARRGC